MRIFQLGWSMSLILELTLKPVCTTHTSKYFILSFSILCNFLLWVLSSGKSLVQSGVAKPCCAVCLGTPSSQLGVIDWQKSWLGPMGRNHTLKMQLPWSTPHIYPCTHNFQHTYVLHSSHEAALMDLFCIAFLFIALKIVASFVLISFRPVS